MMWAVFKEPVSVHVIPLRDDGQPFFHEVDGCLCCPAVEEREGSVPLVIHATAGERRRVVLRAWNLRRELRGKRR